MGRMTLEIRLNFETVRTMLPFLEQAVMDGLLSEEEACRLGAEELLKGVMVTEVSDGRS